MVGAMALMTVAAAAPMPTGARACSEFEGLKRVFPKASAIGFTARKAITRANLRQPIWPGTCKKRYWFTSYSRASAYVDVSLTPYNTHEQALVALNEPLYSPVELLPNGALVRTGSGGASVDGVIKQHAGVASVYRNVFISSVSIAHEPISLAAQVRLHRRIHAGVLAVR